MLRLYYRVRATMHRAGLDVTRWPTDAPEVLAHTALLSCGPDVVVDVGANDGGFARDLRGYGYRGEIVSLEPGAAAFTRLKGHAIQDPAWHVHQLAAGNYSGDALLNIAGNDGASSSILEMGSLHTKYAESAAYVSQETVRVTSLEEFAAKYGRGWVNPALKIDTQGYEEPVLEGCGDWLNAVSAIRLELNLADLYEGAWTWREALSWLEDRGFQLQTLVPGFSDRRSGKLLQVDAVVVRRHLGDFRKPRLR